jgi:hypothetical protein
MHCLIDEFAWKLPPQGIIYSTFRLYEDDNGGHINKQSSAPGSKGAVAAQSICTAANSKLHDVSCSQI